MPRHLSLNHFAFFRGHLEGLPLDTLARRYLHGGLDETTPSRTLQSIRDTLRALAMQHGQLRHARALAIDPARLVCSAPANERSADESADGAPTLEGFRRLVDAQGFYGEAELMQLFRQQSGQRRLDRRQQRRARLRALQIEALEFLQMRVRPEPRPAHAVAAWLPPRLAVHLVAAGIPTLGDLAARMNQGYRWWQTVPGIGAEKAARLRRWLAPHAAVPGLALATTAIVPRGRLGSAVELLAQRAACTQIAPLERFLPPLELDGSQGSLRAGPDRLQIAASDDREAIVAWLTARAANDNTRRAYRREAERLLLWCVFERRKALSSIAAEDCASYPAFLAAPPEGWVSPRNVERWSPAWRPLSGPLSARSQHTALTIVSALFDWLVAQQYLVANPWKALPQPVRMPALDVSRAFTPDQWAAIRGVVDALPDPVRRSRMRLVTELLYHTGLRRSELLAANLGDLREGQIDGGPCWMLTVGGTGGRIRQVPIVAMVMRDLGHDLAVRGLPSDPRDAAPGAPLIAAIASGRRRPSGASSGTARAPVDVRLPVAQLYRELKRVFAAAGAHLQAEGARGAVRVAQGSPHWLRHTFATRSIETVAPEVVGSLLGHASMETTALYVRGKAGRKARGARALDVRPVPGPPASRSRC